MDTILPCKCGGKAEYIEDLYMEGFMSGVTCDTCNIVSLSAHPSGSSEEVKAELITDWNKVMG